MAKMRINISLDEETLVKLKEFATKGHTTVSQWIIDRVWEKAEEQERLEKATKEKTR